MTKTMTDEQFHNISMAIKDFVPYDEIGMSIRQIIKDVEKRRDAIDCVDKDWVIKYCDMMTADKTEFFERETRSRNDSYSNGSYAGSIHTLRDLKHLMETMKRLDKKRARK